MIIFLITTKNSIQLQTTYDGYQFVRVIYDLRRNSLNKTYYPIVESSDRVKIYINPDLSSLNKSRIYQDMIKLLR